VASDFDISHAAAAVYAESVLQLANEAGQAEDIAEELAEAKALWEKEPAFAALMSSAAIDDDARRQSLTKVFGEGRVSRLVLNLLLVLNKKHRSMIFPLVCDVYRHKLDAQLGREEVHVRTATPLSEQQRASLLGQIKRLTGRDGILIEKVDPKVLGGMTVQAADRLYDLTLHRRLQNMRAGLLASLEGHLREGAGRFVTEG